MSNNKIDTRYIETIGCECQYFVDVLVGEGGVERLMEYRNTPFFDAWTDYLSEEGFGGLMGYLAHAIEHDDQLEPIPVPIVEKTPETPGSLLPGVNWKEAGEYHRQQTRNTQMAAVIVFLFVINCLALITFL